MNRDYLKWAALLFALVATASAEYELALAAGFNTWIAAAVPGALDVYTIRAMRMHRDVPATVAAMILVNAASHLVTAGLIPVSVPLVVAVSAIAPLVLYRVHHISRDTKPATTPAPVATPPQPPSPKPVAKPATAAATPRRNTPRPTVATPAARPVQQRSAPTATVAAQRLEAEVEEALRPVATDLDGVQLMTVADVAALKGVAPGTVRSWVSRNKLTPVQRDDDGKSLFHPAAVAELD